MNYEEQLSQPFAHSKNMYERWHTLDEHLLNVAEHTQRFTQDFYSSKATYLGWMVGLIHDIGKVHPGFQSYLVAQNARKSHLKVPHSPWSASYACRLAQGNGLYNYRHLLTLPTAGHHSGLNEIGRLTANLSENYTDIDILIRVDNLFKKLFKQHMNVKPIFPELTDLQQELLIRMLFSALVDADRLDTEKHFEPDKSLTRKNKEGLKELFNKLTLKQEELMKKSSTSLVNKIRKEVYEECHASAAGSPGFYRLTVPTGGGKTRSSLAFALKHALTNGLKRIIYAIPYTSIIEQTTDVFKGILGEEAVLEHHSQLDFTEYEDMDNSMIKLQLAEENWDYPLIVTTTVQLFESLFSNKPAKCRKIHNLARSIIILDEAQNLPIQLLKPTLQVMRDLVENYGASVVFCTATQPALQGEFLEELEGIEIREIINRPENNFSRLKRVRYERISKSVTMNELSDILSKQNQALVILNSRKDAVELVRKINHKYCLHLSTMLCGAHRREILKKVRHSIENKNPILLISTQVVEAGVDLDFPIVYRAIGPLDRIVQAAGRCNREGGPQLGKVVLFELVDSRTPKGVYRAGLEKAKLILAEYKDIEILAEPKIYENYFSQLYGSMANDLDFYRIQEKRKKLEYPEVASLYRLIDSDTIPVIVRYDDYEEVLRNWETFPSRETWRCLQPYLVNVFQWEAQKFLNNGLMSELTKGLYLWEGGYDQIIGIGNFQRDPSDLLII